MHQQTAHEETIFKLPQDTLPPAQALGSVRVPGSKSITQRALLLAALAQGTSRLQDPLESEDTRWMWEALNALGVPVEANGDTWIVTGRSWRAPTSSLWLGASGSALRFLLPALALHAPEPVVLRGEPRLFERPLGPLLQALSALGARWDARPDGGTIHSTRTCPQTPRIRIDAGVSSQFLSGLAMALAARPGGGVLEWSGQPVSAPYLELTRQWMTHFGCVSELTCERWEIPGGCLKPMSRAIPGDWSGAAAFLCAAAVTGRSIQIHPLDLHDAQADRALVAILASSGCTITDLGDSRVCLEGTLQKGLHADLTPCPDLAPVLAATATLAPAPSLFKGLNTLPLKECDRLDASMELVHWLGGRAERLDHDTLRILPAEGKSSSTTPFDPRNDHRMAFAAALGALKQGGSLLNPHCVAKTFPEFWETWSTMLKGAP